MELKLAFRRLVAPQHLNPANTLFGGVLMAWVDEACATYAMCQMQSRKVVTLKISEVLFKTPARQGDFLEFYCETEKVGSTSLTISCTVQTKQIEHSDESKVIAKCSAVFVNVDDFGKSTPFHLKGEKW